MKRGKRQVIEQESHQQKPQQSMNGLQNNYFQTLSNSVSQNTAEQFNNSQPRSVQTPKALEQTSTQSKQIVDDADEKKRKIQLLKQKYLKKNKPEDTKPQSAILQAPIISNQDSSAKNKSLLIENQPKVQPVVTKPKPQPIQSKSVKVENIPQNNEKIIEATSQYQKKIPTFSQSKPTIQQARSKQPKQQNKPEQMIHQQVPKPPSRIPGRNAPPPPPIKKSSPHPQPVSPQPNVAQKPVQKGETDEQILTKTVPSPTRQQKTEEVADLNTKSQRQDITSFAPPSQSNNQASKPEKKGIGQVPPPPPPNRNMKDILNKKLTSPKPVPKPPNRLPQRSIENDGFDNETSPQNQQDWNPMVQQNGYNKPDVSNRTKNVQIDDEYNGTQTTKNYPNKNQSRKFNDSQQTVDPSRFVGEWLGSPELTLKQLYPQLKDVIEFYCLNKHHTLQVNSSSPGFTPLISQFVQAFVINNTTKYTDDQKRVAQSICLNFFYSSPSEFRDIFLILLVKIGEGYLQKYQTAFYDHFDRYLSKLLLHKNLFLPEEINGFVKFWMERNAINQTNFLQFLMLSDSLQLLSLVNNSQISSLKNTLGVLSFCKLNLKNKNFMGLYLKLISNIGAELAKNGLIERILNHMKQLDIPENLYQYAKQLKLRLLKNYENKAQGEDNRGFNKTENNTQPNPSQANKDTGLFGYFNINKAIDKIKISTQKALGAVQKQKKPQQEEKKDQIVYDPIRKRYIINGEIPQDQNGPQMHVSSQTKPKVPPPPPIGGARKAPPPMHNKKPGPRIAVNRYA